MQVKGRTRAQHLRLWGARLAGRRHPSPFPSVQARWARWPRACWPPPFEFLSLRPTNAACERPSCKGRGGAVLRAVHFVGPGGGSGFPWRRESGTCVPSCPCTHRSPATILFPAVPSGARAVSALGLQAGPVPAWASAGELTSGKVLLAPLQSAWNQTSHHPYGPSPPHPWG